MNPTITKHLPPEKERPTIGSLKVGDYFMYNGMLHMRIQDQFKSLEHKPGMEWRIFAVNLERTGMVWFLPETTCTIPTSINIEVWQ